MGFWAGRRGGGGAAEAAESERFGRWRPAEPTMGGRFRAFDFILFFPLYFTFENVHCPLVLEVDVVGLRSRNTS